MELTQEQVVLLNGCIQAVFKETDSMENQMFRYASVVGAVGECAFSVSYPNGTMSDYIQFMNDWNGMNTIEVPFQYLDPDYKF